MGIVLFAMGGYGTYLGWNIRSSPKDKFKTAPLPAPLAGSIADLGKSTAEMHATLMTAMGFIFFLGANSGLVLSLVQDKPITESVHFTTAMIGFVMLVLLFPWIGESIHGPWELTNFSHSGSSNPNTFRIFHSERRTLGPTQPKLISRHDGG